MPSPVPSPVMSVWKIPPGSPLIGSVTFEGSGLSKWPIKLTRKFLRHVQAPTKGKLVRAVETVGADVCRGIDVVLREVNEVVVPCRRNIARERVRNLQVHGLHVRGTDCARPAARKLQAVVHRTANGKKHLNGADVRVDAREGGAGVGSEARVGAARQSSRESEQRE